MQLAEWVPQGPPAAAAAAASAVAAADGRAPALALQAGRNRRGVLLELPGLPGLPALTAKVRRAAGMPPSGICRMLLLSARENFTWPFVNSIPGLPGFTAKLR